MRWEQEAPPRDHRNNICAPKLQKALVQRWQVQLLYQNLLVSLQGTWESSTFSSRDAHGLNAGKRLGYLQERDASDLTREETKKNTDRKKVLCRNQHGNTSTHGLPQINEGQLPVRTP